MCNYKLILKPYNKALYTEKNASIFLSEFDSY